MTKTIEIDTPLSHLHCTGVYALPGVPITVSNAVRVESTRCAFQNLIEQHG